MDLTYELFVKNNFIKFDFTARYSKLYKRGYNYYIEILPKLGTGDNPVVGFELYLIVYQNGMEVINQLNLTNLTSLEMLLEICKMLGVDLKLKK